MIFRTSKIWSKSGPIDLLTITKILHKIQEKSATSAKLEQGTSVRIISLRNPLQLPFAARINNKHRYLGQMRTDRETSGGTVVKPYRGTDVEPQVGQM